MATLRPSTSTGVSRAPVCPQLLVAVMMLVGFTAQSRAFTAKLRQEPSPDASVRGYYVYVRQPRTASGAPLDVGAPNRHPAPVRKGAPRLEGMR
jgi:hypothetical protein